MSKKYYLQKSLHGVPKVSSKAKIIQVGKGASVNIIFIIPILVTIQGHMFEIYITVSKLHGDVDVVGGIIKFIQSEADLGMCELKLNF